MWWLGRRGRRGGPLVCYLSFRADSANRFFLWTIPTLWLPYKKFIAPLTPLSIHLRRTAPHTRHPPRLASRSTVA
jgi:hypothetical protein